MIGIIVLGVFIRQKSEHECIKSEHNFVDNGQFLLCTNCKLGHEISQDMTTIQGFVLHVLR